jgi:protein SCO1/2
VLTRTSSGLSEQSFRALAFRVCASVAILCFPLLGSYTFAEDFPDRLPKELNDIGITEHLGATLSAKDLHFKDDQGKDVVLSDYLVGGKPIILTLVYYECPNLCNLILNGLTDSVKELNQTLKWTPGKQFDIVAVSINPHEKPDLAAKKKAAYLKAYGNPESAGGWHFLTGEDSQIKKLASQVGFGYRYDAEAQQYAHASAIYVVTPEGKISRYLYGIEFPAKDLRLALLEASHGRIGTVIDRFLLFCYRYDPKTRKYSVMINRVMDAGVAGTVLVFGGYLAVFWLKERRKIAHASSDDETKGA